MFPVAACEVYSLVGPVILTLVLGTSTLELIGLPLVRLQSVQ